MDGERGPVDAVEAAAGHEPPRVAGAPIGRDFQGRCAFTLPRPLEVRGDLPARFDEQRAPAHRRIADLQRQDGPGRQGLFEQRSEGALDQHARDGARGVVRPGATALLAGPEVQRPRGDPRALARRGPGGEDLAQLVGRRRGLHGPGELACERQPCSRREVVDPRLAGERRELGEIDDHVVGLEGEARPGGDPDVVAHQPFVGRAEVLDVERLTNALLPAQVHQRIERAKNSAVGDPRQRGRIERPAVVEGASDRDDAGPGVKALFQSVTRAGRVCAEPRVKAGERPRRGAGPGLHREQASILGEEHEHRPQDHGAEARQQRRLVAREPPPRLRVIRGSKAQHQLAQRGERLGADGLQDGGSGSGSRGGGGVGEQRRFSERTLGYLATTGL